MQFMFKEVRSHPFGFKAAALNLSNSSNMFKVFISFLTKSEDIETSKSKWKNFEYFIY